MIKQEVITLEMKEFETLMTRLENMEKMIQEGIKPQPFKERWLTNKEVCAALDISSRTLQQYRDNQSFSFSKVNGKMYYKASDIENFIIKHYE